MLLLFPVRNIRLKCLFRFCLMVIDLCASQSIRNRLEISVFNTVISSISNFGDKSLPRCVSHGSENSWDICPKSSRTRQKRSGSCLPVFAIIRMDNEVIPDQFLTPYEPQIGAKHWFREFLGHGVPTVPLFWSMKRCATKKSLQIPLEYLSK